MADERMFSQEEVDQIISERLKRERTKYQQEAAQRAAELDKRERLLTAKVDWQKRGLPVELLDSIDLSKDGALEAAEIAVAGIRKSTDEDIKTASFPMFTKGMGGIAPAEKVDNIRSAFGLDHRKDE